MTAQSNGPERIVGGYRLGRSLGEGAQGCVFHGVRIADGLEAAVKLYELPIDPKPQDQARRRHQREAKILGRVTSKAIVGLIEVGEHLEPSIHRQLAGSLWSAFEFVEGRHLRHMMSLATVEPRKLLLTLRGLAEGLDLVHSTGGLHRDIKPENVILRKKKWDDPVLVDFGLARNKDASRLTRTGVPVGTAFYIAPEVQRGIKPDRASDQWSFARLAVELLLWATDQSAEDIPDGAAARDDIVERLDDWQATSTVASRALDPEPDSRYDDLGSFVAALEEALHDDGVLETEEPKLAFTGERWDKRRALSLYLQSCGCVVRDKRPAGGRLWVIAGDEFEPLREYLSSRGVYFQPARGKATGHQPGYWTAHQD